MITLGTLITLIILEITPSILYPPHTIPPTLSYQNLIRQFFHLPIINITPTPKDIPMYSRSKLFLTRMKNKEQRKIEYARSKPRTLQNLTLLSAQSLSIFELKQICEISTNISSLMIEKVISDYQVKQIARLKSLKTLVLNINQQFPFHYLSELTRLRDVELSSFNLGAHQLKEMHKYLPNLKSITLKKSLRIDLEAIKALSQFTSLQKLSLEYISIKEHFLQLIPQLLPCIKAFKLSWCDVWELGELEAIGLFKSLQTLSLIRIFHSVDHRDHQTYRVPEHLILPILKECRDLKRLQIDDLPISADEIEHMYEMEHLKEIKLMKIRALPETIPLLLRNLNGMIEFWLSFEDYVVVEDSLITHFLTRNQSLKVLILKHSLRIPPSVVYDMGRCLPNLTHLCLKTSDTCDEGLIALKRLKNLRQLEIRSEVSDHLLYQMLKNFRHLVKLSGMKRSRRVTANIKYFSKVLVK